MFIFLKIQINDTFFCKNALKFREYIEVLKQKLYKYWQGRSHCLSPVLQGALQATSALLLPTERATVTTVTVSQRSLSSAINQS